MDCNCRRRRCIAWPLRQGPGAHGAGAARPGSSLLRGAILLRAGKVEEAVGVLQQAVRFTGLPEARELLAEAYEACGEEQAARKLRAPVKLGRVSEGTYRGARSSALR